MAGPIEWHEGEYNAFFLTAAGAVIIEIAVTIEGAAKRSCPVDTGRLRSSITHEIELVPGKVRGRVGSNVEYAAYVELGTRRTRAQPYLRPALASVQGKVFR